MPEEHTHEQTVALLPSLQNTRGIVVRRQGLEISRDLPYDDWARIGSWLRDLNAASPWMLGDWMAYGDAKFTESHWGKRNPEGLYDRVSASTGLSSSTLANLKYVCKALHPSRRRDGLTVGHAQEIVGRCKTASGQHDIKEQDRWIKEVVTTGMPVKILREKLRRAHAKVDIEQADRGTLSILESARQFARDFQILESEITQEAKREALRILTPVLERMRG